MMGTCLSHSQCPVCATKGNDRNGDNLGSFADGSQYCFSCGFYKTASGSRRQHTSSATARVPNKVIQLPSDACSLIPASVRKILSDSYGLTDDDLRRNVVLWTEFHQRLVFPIFTRQEGLTAYLGRYYGSEKNKPKWYTQGDLKNIIHVIGKHGDNTLVLTEDIISAIKVSHLQGISGMPIFGSHVPNLMWIRLKHLYPNHKIYLWLDKDKQKDSIKFTYQARQLGLPVDVIITDKDPKEYTEEEIRKYLTN